MQTILRGQRTSPVGEQAQVHLCYAKQGGQVRERCSAIYLLAGKSRWLTGGTGTAESIDNILTDATIDTGITLTLVDVDLTVSATETCNQEEPFVITMIRVTHVSITVAPQPQ